MKSTRFVTAILLAAGEGRRMSEGAHTAGTQTQSDPHQAGAKQFMDLDGEPMYLHPLRALEHSASVTAVVIVVPSKPPDWLHDSTGNPKVCSWASGGESRQASLANGLVCIPDDTEVVMVHDAARPLIRPDLVDAVAGAIDATCDGAICALPMQDAVKEVSMDGWILRGLPREPMWRAQTPQAFWRKPFEEALAAADAQGHVAEDCSDLLTRQGGRVKVIEGDPFNLKITRTKDLALAESILKSRSGG